MDLRKLLKEGNTREDVLKMVEKELNDIEVEDKKRKADVKLREASRKALALALNNYINNLAGTKPNSEGVENIYKILKEAEDRISFSLTTDYDSKNLTDINKILSLFSSPFPGWNVDKILF